LAIATSVIDRSIAPQSCPRPAIFGALYLPDNGEGPSSKRRGNSFRRVDIFLRIYLRCGQRGMPEHCLGGFYAKVFSNVGRRRVTELVRMPTMLSSPVFEFLVLFFLQ
jgi:hypothetical protein